jgi:hypothetical protein
MKNKKIIFIFSLIVFVSICFTACDMTNPIIGKWWAEKEPEEPEYIALLKILPGSYDTIIQEKIVYETIFVQLPPQIVYETQYETKYIYEYIYEQLPPEVIYEVVVEIQKETEYVTVYEEIEKIVEIQTPPDKDTIIEWLKDPANKDDVEEIIRIIKESIPVDVIKEIIKEISPENIIEYLTDEQIEYIVKQQPPQMILQSIKIIGIEYVIFAGDSPTVNGAPVPPATTQLTAQEKAYNTSTIGYMAQLLKDNPTYIIMLHGHANPISFTEGEKSELTTLSNNRATDVRRVLMTEYNKLDGNRPASYENPNLKDRVSCSGYGGEKTLFGNNTTYTALNRRVEMILFEIATTVVDG